DPDDGERGPAERDGAADDAGVTGEAAPPVARAEDDHRWPVLLVLDAEHAPERGGYVQDLEVVARDHVAPGAFRLPGAVAKAQLHHVPGREIRGLRAGAPV